MAKLLGLDLGDQWVGVAISDALQIVARPYATVSVKDLPNFLLKTLESEPITTVIVGYPTTLSGTISQQTEKVLKQVEQLKQQFSSITWILWDERLSTQRAELGQKLLTKKEKLKAQAKAAAFILDSYLTYQLHHKPK
jgi:putative Holliday junction resolvase